MGEQGKKITWQQNERYQELFSDAEYIGEGVTAVALAARHDLIGRMIADAREQQLMAVQIGATPYNAAYTDALPEWLITYLPAGREQDVKETTT